MKNTGKGRVLVAMSGGIDSSVAAIMLHNEGYEVIGITMKTWDYASAGSSKKETGCCSLDSINDARSIAVRYGFPHYILDIRGEFGDHVIDNFVDEYLAGRTPNPCVMCNTHIKWEALLRRADMLKCDFIATGHYAKVREENGRYVITRGLDLSKDQSYVLWGVTQECLSRTMFPIGGFTKSRIKEMAREMDLHELANKSESYEICFVPDNDYRAFLRHRIPGLDEIIGEGDFKDKDGKVLGRHKGYPFYTIGQRKGLDIALGAPAYVTAIHPDSNTVILGSAEDLLENSMQVRNLNLVKYADLDQPINALIKIRYKDPGTPGVVYRAEDGNIRVKFDRPVSAIAPGQSAVFYEGEDVIGGGFIEHSYNNQRIPLAV